MRFQAGRYAHARQFKRMRKVVRRQSTIVRKLGTAIETKMTALSEAVKDALGTPLAKAKQFVAQARTRKVKGRNSAQSESTPKICSWHAPEADRIYAVLCAAGYNIRWLLRMILKKDIGPFLCLIFFARRFAHIGSRFVSITDGQCLRGRISARRGLRMNISGTTT